MDWSAVDYCDVFIRLSFWRHPFTAEHPLLLWCFYQTLILTAPIHCRASIAIVMFLSDSHSDGTHSLQSIHCYCDCFLSDSHSDAPIHCRDPLLLWCFYQTLILTAPIHCRESIAIVMFLSDSHSDGTHSLQSIHCYCDVFIRLSFWRHPFTAEHPLLLWCFYQTLILTAPIHCRASIAIVMVYQTLILTAPIHCRASIAIVDVFIRLSFWRHPFTAEHPLLLWCVYQTLILTAPIHCRASIAETLMQRHISTNLMKKQTH